MKYEKSIIICAIGLPTQIASTDTLNINADQNTTSADNNYRVTITTYLTNSTVFSVSNTRVSVTADSRSLSADRQDTNVHDITTVHVRSWNFGNAAITAQATNATNDAVNVIFVRGSISMIILPPNLTCAMNTANLVTATSYDAVECEEDICRWWMMPNVTLNFTITSPPDNKWNCPITHNSANIIPPMNNTDESGITTAIALIGKRAEMNVIEAIIINEDGDEAHEYRTIIDIAGTPVNFSMIANPENASVNGINVLGVMGMVTDKFPHYTLSAGSIRFNTTDNSLVKPLDSVGTATISAGSSIFTSDVVLNGTYLDGGAATRRISQMKRLSCSMQSL